MQGYPSIQCYSSYQILSRHPFGDVHLSPTQSNSPAGDTGEKRMVPAGYCAPTCTLVCRFEVCQLRSRRQITMPRHIAVATASQKRMTTTIFPAKVERFALLSMSAAA